MNEKDALPFLSRWSRRKLETRETEPAGPPVVEVPPASEAQTEAVAAKAPAATAPGAAPVPLPSVESLQGIASEYKDFLKPGVDETVKRAALKKLFNDPHFGFASMDKLDTYIDDYSIEDPIPEAMLRSLNQSKSLFLFEEKKEEGAEGVQTAQPAAEAVPPAELASPDEPGAAAAAELSQSPDVAAKQVDPLKPG